MKADKKRNNELIIRGIITPSDWDERGNVIEIALSTFDEKMYFIDKDEKGSGLLPFIREEIELIGMVRHEDGLRKIKVDNYRLKRRAKENPEKKVKSMIGT